ncbi:MAG: glycosyltransferase family 4 protein [Candidatus Omnitrophica bacterium]|nr:glycosyltransferase family 4 protein [Candidatus Omnitrophota bacterium]MCM8791333.1 glycosyltransferase family 4 protein [Candidatus Omnitrophota bacterium]
MKKITMLLTNAFMPDPRPHREALSLVSAGYHVRLIAWDRGENLSEKERVDGIEVERIRIKSRHGRGLSQLVFIIIVWLRMTISLLKENQDLIYCHDFDTLIPGFIAAALTKKKVIFDSHEVYSRMLGKNVPGFMKNVIAWLEKIFVKMASHIIVTCEAMKLFYEKIGAKKITVVANYKEPSFFRFSTEFLQKERERLGASNKTIISYIANLGPERIIEPLLDAVKDDDSLFLIVGGDGVKKRVVEKAAAICRRIKYLGYVAPDKVPLYTAIADIVYYGYDKTAGMAEFCNPNKLFEALAVGCAFLGGSFGEMGRIIREEVCGIALEDFTKDSVASALKKMKEPQTLERLKENARRAGSEKYVWKIAEERLLSAVADTLSK